MAIPRPVHRLALRDDPGRRPAPRHAVVEQVFADLASGPLAHLPSGNFPANAAWLALAAITHNLLRAAGALASASFAKARGATLRRDLIAVAARIARHGRGYITVHLPEGWHRDAEWVNLFEAACGPPAARGLTSPDPVSAPARPQRPPATISQQKSGQIACSVVLLRWSRTGPSGARRGDFGSGSPTGRQALRARARR